MWLENAGYWLDELVESRKHNPVVDLKWFFLLFCGAKRGGYSFFFWSCGRDIYASSTISGKKKMGKEERENKKPHTVWRWFSPRLDGLAHIRPLLPSAVVVWLRCSFTAVSFSDGCFFFLFFFLPISFARWSCTTIRPTTTTVWKMFSKSLVVIVWQKGNGCLVFWVFCGRPCVPWPQATRWILLLFSIRSNNSLFID